MDRKPDEKLDAELETACRRLLKRRPPPRDAVRSVLLISLSCIGDVVLTTPVVHALKTAYPSAEIDVVAGKNGEPALRSNDWIRRTIVFDNRGKHRGLKGMLSFLKELRKRRYDLVVDLRNSLFPYAVRARRRFTSFAAHRLNRASKGKHAAERHLDVLRSHGLPAREGRMMVGVNDAARQTADRLLADLGPGGKPFAVAPGAGGDYKRYPPEKMAEAARYARSKGAGIPVLVGGPGDVEAGAVVERLCGAPLINLIGKTDLGQTAAVVQKCRFLLSNDSGPMHLASAAGIPVLAVFGPTDAERYGPVGHPASRVVWERRECNPCKTPHCGLRSCIDDIPVERVESALDSLLEALRPDQA